MEEKLLHAMDRMAKPKVRKLRSQLPHSRWINFISSNRKSVIRAIVKYVFEFVHYQALVVEGEMLWLTKITRSEMGIYLCIASNQVPPSVSKRMKLQIHCKYIWIFVELFCRITIYYYINTHGSVYISLVRMLHHYFSFSFAISIEQIVFFHYFPIEKWWLSNVK